MRHDGHALGAFSGLSLVFGILLLYFNQYIKSIKQKYLIVLFVIVSMITGLCVRSYYCNGGNITINNIMIDIVNDIKSYKNKFIEISRIFSKQKIEELNSQYRESIENIKKVVDFTDIKGSVDIYPWDQSFVIAHELDFRPRPLFQSYSVYTTYLINKNIVFLKSNKAPENIIFSIKEIDGRAPFMMEGTSWLDIMSRYVINDFRGEFLILKKTNFIKPFSLNVIEQKKVSFDEIIDIPKGKIIFMKINIKKTFLGHLMNLLYKMPILYIEIVYDNGYVNKYRIVPEIAKNGFILSPNVLDIYDFYNLFMGNINFNIVKSIKVINEKGIGYKNKINIEFYEVKYNFSNKIINKTIGIHLLEQKLKQLEFYKKIIYLNKDIIEYSKKAGFPLLRFFYYKNDLVLFSHVGTKFKVYSSDLMKISQNGKVSVFYSIQDEAYQGDNKCEGACFKIFEENKLVFSHCIDPRNIKNDRKLHETYINVKKDINYYFEIVPIYGSASWGWSYWVFK